MNSYAFYMQISGLQFAWSGCQVTSPVFDPKASEATPGWQVIFLALDCVVCDHSYTGEATWVFCKVRDRSLSDRSFDQAKERREDRSRPCGSGETVFVLHSIVRTTEQCAKQRKYRNLRCETTLLS